MYASLFTYFSTSFLSIGQERNDTSVDLIACMREIKSFLSTFVLIQITLNKQISLSTGWNQMMKNQSWLCCFVHMAGFPYKTPPL